MQLDTSKFHRKFGMRTWTIDSHVWGLKQSVVFLLTIGLYLEQEKIVSSSKGHVYWFERRLN